MVGVAQDHPIPIVNFAVQKPDAGRQFVLCNWVRPRQRSGTLLCLSRRDLRKRRAWKRARADSPHVIVVGTNLDPISTVCNFPPPSCRLWKFRFGALRNPFLDRLEPYLPKECIREKSPSPPSSRRINPRNDERRGGPWQGAESPRLSRKEVRLKPQGLSAHPA